MEILPSDNVNVSFDYDEDNEMSTNALERAFEELFEESINDLENNQVVEDIRRVQTQLTRQTKYYLKKVLDKVKKLTDATKLHHRQNKVIKKKFKRLKAKKREFAKEYSTLLEENCHDSIRKVKNIEERMKEISKRYEKKAKRIEALKKEIRYLKMMFLQNSDIHDFIVQTIDSTLDEIQQDIDRQAIQQQGLTPRRISRFGVFTADESHAGEQCSICMEDVDVGRRMMRLSCDGQHAFCQVCIEGWFADHNTSPLCRHAFN